MSYFKKACLLSTLMILSSLSHAKLALSTLIMHFEPNQPTFQEVIVENTSADIMYVSIDPTLVESPNTQNEKRLTFASPRELGLLISQRKLIVPAKSKVPVRISYLNRKDAKDQVYRVTFTPVVKGVSSEGVALKTIIAYDMLVFVQPREPKPDIVAKRLGQSIQFTNEGNTNVLLMQGRQCISKIVCSDLPATRLYAGNSWSIDLPYKDRPVQYVLGVGNKNIIKTF